MRGGGGIGDAEEGCVTELTSLTWVCVRFGRGHMPQKSRGADTLLSGVTLTDEMISGRVGELLWSDALSLPCP